MRTRNFRPSTKLAYMLTIALAFGLAWTAKAQTDWPAPDIPAINKFEEEGLQHSHAMEVLGYLTDVYGPRLTNSPNIRQAADYAVKTLSSWGLANVHEEQWGPFGEGWSNELFQANEIAPRHFPLIAYPKAWTLGTNGPITAEAVYAKIENDGDFGKYKGKLKGKFVLTAPMRAVDVHFDAPGHRYTDQELSGLAQPEAVRPPPDRSE